MNSLQRIKASYELFDDLKCCSADLKGGCDDAALALLEEDKMRCHIMNCLAALRVVQIQKKIKQKAFDDDKHELVKSKVFAAACSMMIDTEFNNDNQFDYDEIVVTTILSSFPDKSKMPDERGWFSMHFAIALFVQNKISAEDVYMLHATDVLVMYRLSGTNTCYGSEAVIGCAPAHLLCMQKEPNMSMVRYFCLRDPKAFLFYDRSGRCALHLVAQYSESVELLKTILQIDQAMTKIDFEDDEWEHDCKPLGLLCRRLEFPTFHQMVTCLIQVDNSVEVIRDGIIGCLRSYRFTKSEYQFLNPGSRGERMLILLEILLNANLDVVRYGNSCIFHQAGSYLKGQLGVAVLSLFLSKDITGVKSINGIGSLPIHYAAASSSLDVLKLLHKAYLESLSILTGNGDNLLHLALDGECSDIADRMDKIQYLCHQCPAFIHQKNNGGETPLHTALYSSSRLDTNTVIYLCNTDATIVRDKYTPSDINHFRFERLPLHHLVRHMRFPKSELSNGADCFRLFLRLYPASAGIKDGHSESPYDLAISCNLSAYFIRLLLSADPTIDPEQRCNMNFAARRDGMFLAFRALSPNVEPIIWAKIRFEDKDLLAHVISYL